MKQQLYQIFVNRIPKIREHYLLFRQNGGGRWMALLYLLWLNLRYCLPFSGNSIFEIPRLPRPESESSLSGREPPELFAEKLAAADVISFDVFDTLILRPFSHPSDLFYLVGMKLHYPDFRQIRMEAEQHAREKQYRQSGTCEVTLEQIWAEMERETGIPMEIGVQVEWDCEWRCCTANPYLFQIVKELRRRGKRMVVTSDMYLGKNRIRELLDLCGYGTFSEYFVSGDAGVSKSSGELYDLLRRETNGTIVHVGDHPISDCKQAQLHHIQAYWYPSVQQLGGRYRVEDLSSIVGSIYRGLVNSHLYNGTSVFSREYEYGYVYGGLFVIGYCRFLHEYAERYSIDKILFLSRDGFLLQKAYQRMYPEEHTEYLYWSRLAALKLTAGFYKADYFRRFLFHKTSRHDTIRKILEAMELNEQLDPICQAIGVKPEEELTPKIAEMMQEYLLDNWNQVLEHYQEQVEAGGKYIQGILGDCQTAVAVDIGWAASGAMMLDTAVRRLWGMECRIIGMVAGTNSFFSAEPDNTELFRMSGQVVSYLFSQAENRDIWKFHDPANGHNLYWELLLGAPEGSLIGFYLNKDGNPVCRFKPKPSGADRICEIHRGILDFVEQFLELETRIGWEIPISGRDACAPMLVACSRKNRKFMKDLEDLMDEAHIG
ncbi:MAG: hypothetical protein ACOX6P_05655 [Candidatus Merdivicinus sp.]